MFPQHKKIQQTFPEQSSYLPILKAEGLSKSTLKYYREKITI